MIYDLNNINIYEFINNILNYKIIINNDNLNPEQNYLSYKTTKSQLI